MSHIIYKKISSDEEWEQVYVLNYQTFVEEIEQHQINEEATLMDRFREEDTYFIAKKADEVIGMITLRTRRPFSLDLKLNQKLDDLFPNCERPCEIRLLAVKKEHRSRDVFYKLCQILIEDCLDRVCDLVFISGVDHQRSLYEKIGFRIFAPMIPGGRAHFYPMCLLPEHFHKALSLFSRMSIDPVTDVCNFLPGPVSIHSNVKKALTQDCISHRAQSFIHQCQEVRQQLLGMTQARHVEIAVGTGTLSNDLVAAQLSQLPGKGLILSNGEFGERLFDHAQRIHLSFERLQKPWDTPVTLEEVEHVLKQHPDIRWLWTVHCETSTGYLYPVAALLKLCQRHQIHLCLDACSSLGIVPLDLSEVYLASSVSGKGLGSYPGLSLVFHQKELVPCRYIPRYLDLGFYQQNQSVPFTHSSNLVAALHEGIKCLASFEEISRKARLMRHRLCAYGYVTLGDACYSPGIITIALPENRQKARIFGEILKSKGFLISYESDYLLERGWAQISLMGHHTSATLTRLDLILRHLARVWARPCERVEPVPVALEAS